MREQLRSVFQLIRSSDVQVHHLASPETEGEEGGPQMETRTSRRPLSSPSSSLTSEHEVCTPVEITYVDLT